jgi:hypothetical protein
VVGLAAQVAVRDQEREVDVLGAGDLDAIVERALDALPDRVAVRPDHHRAAHRPVLGELGAAEHVLVPPREVRGLRGQDARHAWK